MPDSLLHSMLGPYHLRRLLGKGGMAEVYLAYDEAHQREVAVKVVHRSNADYLERFWREIAAIDKLQHPHILPAYDYDTEGEWHYLVILYAPGGTLKEWIKEKPLSLEHANQLLAQVADALHYAHCEGIIHRDIKPSNILLRDEHYAYLADFGLAKSVEGSRELTQTGTLLGTPEYMAPELAEGAATPASDIYALGITLYQMITGHLPFLGETPLSTFWKQLQEQPPRPSVFNSELSPAIDAVLLRALAKDPRKRYQTALELAADFQQALEYPEIQPPSQATGPTPRTQQQFVLSETAAPATVRKPSTSSFQLPPLTTHTRNTPSTETFRPTEVRRTVPPRSPRHRHRIIVSIVLVGFLLIVGVPMAALYYLLSHSPQNTVQPTVSAQPTQQDRTPQAQATATTDVPATIAASPPLFADPLTVANQNWANDGTRCRFTENGYHSVVQQTNYLQPCALLNHTITDSAIQVDVQLHSGSNAGLLLRLQREQFYDFEITSDGQFFFRRHDAGAGANYVYLLAATSSPAIRPGDVNTLLAIATGSTFILYINGTPVGTVQDERYSSGQVALAAGTLAPITSGDASFTNFRLVQP